MDQPLHETVARMFDGSRPGTPGDDLLQIARIIGEERALYAGREQMHIDNVMAQACQAFEHTMSAQEFGPSPLRPIFSQVWPMLNSVIGMRNRIISGQICNSAADVLACLRAYVCRTERALAMTTAEAEGAIRAILAPLQARYPQLGLSFGYLGNCDLAGRRWDDRSWQVFTTLRSERSILADLSFGGVPTSHLGFLAIRVEEELADWCADQAIYLAEGRLYSLSIAA